MSVQSAPSATRIPTLDGWRAIAILAVLASHIQEGYLHHFAWGLRWLDLGRHGVTIFFVISGYLITGNFLTRHTLNLPQFYVRRFFRLMPAAWTYLLFLILLTGFTRMKVIGADLWGCLFFYRNYLSETAANTCTQHFWSLSLEEQFYLVWPPVFLLLGRRKSAYAAAFGAVSIALFRILSWSSYLPGVRFQRTEVRADSLMVGCLLALLLQHETVSRWFRAWGVPIFSMSALLFLVDLYFYNTLIPLHESVLIALMIGATALNPGMIASRVLEIDHLKTTGIMSYSIYLWQDFFLRLNWSIYGPFLLIFFSFFSWLCIEKPCIALGRGLIERSRALNSQQARLTGKEAF